MSAGSPEPLSALEFLPRRVTLPSLQRAARGCQGCPLYRHATQTVFGEGPVSARVLLVGEQPGDEEDRRGHPFVGPAGRVLDEGLAAAGIDRSAAYVTNVVKHFKWEARGRRRLHRKPGAREVAACLPWLEKEIELIAPEVLVCLGATATQALAGHDVRVTRDHGKPLETTWGRTIATVHPSSILRQRTEQERRRAMAQFTADLRVVARMLERGA